MGRPAGMPLILVYRGGSAGQWGRSRPPAGFCTRSRNPFLFSLAETSALLLTNGERRARAAGKGKVFAHLDLGWSCLLNLHLFVTFHFLLLTFPSLLFFLLQKIWKLEILGGCAPPPEGPLPC